MASRVLWLHDLLRETTLPHTRSWHLCLCIKKVTHMTLLLGSAKNFFLQKSDYTMEVGGWVQISLGTFLLENRPKIVLNQW